MRGHRPWPESYRAQGLLIHVLPPAAAGAPASHPKYMCSLVSASLGWIRAQLWGPYRQAGLNLGSLGEGLGQEGTMRSKGRGVSRRLGSFRQPYLLCSHTGPTRGLFTPFSRGAEGTGTGRSNTHKAGT